MLTTIELPEEVIHFELPEAVQSRLQFLLDKQDEGEEMGGRRDEPESLCITHERSCGGITFNGTVYASLVSRRLVGQRSPHS